MKISKSKLSIINFEGPLKKTNISNEETEIKDKMKILNDKMNEEKKSLLQIPFKKDSNTFNLLLYSLGKKNKTENDILFISHYLTSFSSIIQLIDKKKTLVDSSKILNEISNHIKTERYNKNDLIFRYGDIGDKFYLILQGNVSIIIKKEIKVKMTDYEFYCFLLNLKSYSENQLVEENLKANKLKIDINEMRKYIEGQLNYQIPFSEKIIKYPSIKFPFLDYCSCEDYINRLSPVINKEENSDRKQLNLCIYYNVINLKEEETFGDIALSGNFKRTASIICNEDCIFATLTKKIYENCIKTSLEKIRAINLYFLVNCDLFKGVKPDNFLKKYFNYFKIIHLNQGSFLFKQGDKREEIYIIKEGLIEINVKSSYKELINLINTKDYIIDEALEKKELKRKNVTLGNLLNEQKIFKIIKLGENEIIGLDDYIDNNNSFYCNAICKSNYIEIFSIDYKVFCDICEKDWKVNKNLIKYNKKRVGKIFAQINLIRNNSLHKDLLNIQKDSNEKIKEIETQKELMKINKNNVLLNSVYSNQKFRKIFKYATRNKRNNFRYFIYTKSNSIGANNNNHYKEIYNNKSNYFSSEDNLSTKNLSTYENTLKLIKTKIHKRKKVKSLNSLSISDSISLIQNKEINHYLNKELSSRRVLIPIKPLVNDYSQKKIKELKLQLYSSTFIHNSRNNIKEKNIIDKIYHKALYNDECLSDNNRNSNRKTNSIEHVDFLIMDKAFESSFPKKNKFTFFNQPKRKPLNYKNHSPSFKINEKSDD